MEFSYKNLVDINVFPKYSKPILTEGAMAEILAFYIFLVLDNSVSSRTTFVMYYLLYYSFEFNLVESNMYMIDQLDLVIAELDKEINMQYQVEKRFEVKFTKDQEKFMADFEYNSMHQKGYDGNLGTMLYTMINSFGPTEDADHKYRLLFEIHTLAFLMRKYMTIGSRDGKIKKTIYLPKYNYPRRLKNGWVERLSLHTK